jgi:hypothetical protein
MILLPACDSSESNGNVDNTDFEASETFSYPFSAERFNSVRVAGINGYVWVTGEPDGTSISISGERRIGSESVEDAREHLAELEVLIDDSGDALTIETEQPEETRGRNYVVDYEITVPSSMAVRVINVNGEVELGLLEATLSAEVVNGDIECIGTSIPQGDITFSTTNGDIELGIPAASSAVFTATVENGTISVSNLDFADEQRSPTRVYGVLGAGDVTIELTTVNGSIYVGGIE